MNKQELLTEITEFINSDQVEENDGDIDLGKVAAQLEEFVGDLDEDDDEELEGNPEAAKE